MQCSTLLKNHFGSCMAGNSSGKNNVEQSLRFLCTGRKRLLLLLVLLAYFSTSTCLMFALAHSSKAGFLPHSGAEDTWQNKIHSRCVLFLPTHGNMQCMGVQEQRCCIRQSTLAANCTKFKSAQSADWLLAPHPFTLLARSRRSVV